MQQKKELHHCARGGMKHSGLVWLVTTQACDICQRLRKQIWASTCLAQQPFIDVALALPTWVDARTRSCSIWFSKCKFSKCNISNCSLDIGTPWILVERSTLGCTHKCTCKAGKLFAYVYIEHAQWHSHPRHCVRSWLRFPRKSARAPSRRPHPPPSLPHVGAAREVISEASPLCAGSNRYTLGRSQERPFWWIAFTPNSQFMGHPHSCFSIFSVQHLRVTIHYSHCLHLLHIHHSMPVFCTHKLLRPDNHSMLALLLHCWVTWTCHSSHAWAAHPGTPQLPVEQICLGA